MTDTDSVDTTVKMTPPGTVPGHWLLYIAIAVFGLGLFYVGFKLGRDIFPPVFAIYLSATTFTLNILTYALTYHFLKKEGFHSGIFRRGIFRRGIFRHVFLTVFFILTNFYAILAMFYWGAPMVLSIPLSSTGSILLSVLFGVLILREPLNRRKICGIVLALLAIFLINYG